MTGQLLSPLEVLIGTAFGLLFGLALAGLVGWGTAVIGYTTDRSVPGSAGGSIATGIAGAAAVSLDVVRPVSSQLPRTVIGAGIIFVLGLYGTTYGARVALELPRVTEQPTVREPTLTAGAIEAIDAAGRVTIRAPSRIGEFEGYPPLDSALRTALEDERWRLPADLPLSELETRLADRLRTTYDLDAIDVSIDGRGRAAITAAPRVNAIAERVPNGDRAVSLEILVPRGLGAGDHVRLATEATTVSGTVLRTSGGADGIGCVTVAVPTTDASPLLETDRARLVVHPRGTTPTFDAIALLERSGETIRTTTVTESVRDALGDGSVDVTPVAVRSIEPGASDDGGWTIAPDVGEVECGADVVLVGRDASTVGDDRPARNERRERAPAVNSR